MQNNLLLTKSEENSKSANILIEHAHYNSSVHCVYYACYQIVILITYNSQNTYNNDRAGSHERMINCLITLLQNANYDSDKIKVIHQNLTFLKKNRTKANYKNVLFNEEKTKETYICAQNTQVLLKEILDNKI